MLGLVMTAGGARGAYQVGVLKRVAEIPVLGGQASPFAIVAGASAGAINGAILAAHAGRFSEATHQLAQIWSELSVDQVFRTDIGALARCGASLGRDFTVGSMLGSTITRSFFDTAPLAALLEMSFPPDGIEQAIRKRQIYAVAVAATSYHSGRSYTFIEGRRGHAVWARARRVVMPVKLTYRHILASGAIPIVFPPVNVEVAGQGLWFGDGGLRLVAPMSPAIRLGATHVFAVGIRCSRTATTLADEEAGSASHSVSRLDCPPLAQICGVFMNAIFLDHLESDLDHLIRMNELIEASGHAGETVAAAQPMKPIVPLVVSPSEDIALVAQRFVHRMPRFVRFALDGLGTPDAQSADLISYLLFDAAYTRTLVDLGYNDASERIDEIEQFLAASGALRNLKRRSRVVAAGAGPKARRMRPNLEIAK